jgi:hypothetical protein
MSTFTFGSDPEFMICKDGQLFSAIGIVPGTKDKKHKSDGNCFYYDNVLAECTVKPAKNKEEAISNIRHCLKTYAELIAPYKLIVRASANYPKSQLKHKDAIAIGCKREYCAYGLKEIEPPEETMQTKPLRSAGGHIHIGSKFAQKSVLNTEAIIRMMDLFVGLPSVYLDNDPTSKKRKELYGQAGRFRKPKHGAEYRSLSNFWLSSPRFVGLAHDLTSLAVDAAQNGKYENWWKIDHKTLNNDEAWDKEDFDPASCHVCAGYDVTSLRCAIDNLDRERGKKLFNDFLRPLLPQSIYVEFEKLAVPQNTDLYKEWSID